MEASAPQLDCDLENDEEEDLEFFQKSIKVHDRFGGNCDEEDEFFSDDEPDESISCPKGGYLKPAVGYNRLVLNSEAKLETISMLDNVRSSCCKSGHDLSLGMLNLKSDEVGLGDLEGVLLGKSILSCGPPFGDPLSKMDIFDSALSLLDDKTCQEFREKGLFDELGDRSSLSELENEMKSKEEDVGCVGAKLDLLTSRGRQTSEPYCNILDSPANFGKPAYELHHEDVSKQVVRPSVKSELLGPLVSCQIKKSRQSQSANSSRKQLTDSDSLDSKGSIGREFPPNNLSLDDLVRYINGESLKKVCSKKTSTPSSTLPQIMAVNTKKLKKQVVKKHDVATTAKARAPPAANRIRKTTKKASHVGVVRTEEFTEDGCPQVFSDVDFVTTSSKTTETTASAKEVTSASDAEHEDENTEQEEFIAVLHKRRVRTRKELLLNQDMHSAGVVSLRTKAPGHQPEKTSARIDKDLGSSTASLCSVWCKSYRSDTSGGSITSKRGSLSSLDESPPLATYENSALGTYTRNQGHAEVPNSRPSFSKFSAGNSYASALLQNLPKLSVTGSREISQTQPGTVESATFSSPLNSEAENEMLLSPPQSEADTGFSSSSSLSPDEAHVSLACDSAAMMSKRNPIDDSEPTTCHPSNESSMLKRTVHHENLEQPIEECVDDGYLSHHVSNLDFPLTRISELSGRTNEEQRNAGEPSLACSSCRDLSCANEQSKNAPVIFDTRIRAFTHKLSSSDIVFLFDAEDSSADAMSNVGSYVAVDDIDGITFTGSPDSMRLATGASEKADVHSTVLDDIEASCDVMTYVASGGFELTDEPDVERQRGIWVSDDQTCDGYILQRDSEHEYPVNSRRLVESSVSKAVHSTPCGSFDLFAAQKFFSEAFRSVLRHEHECPGQVVRL